jgi:surface antigen
VFDSIKTFGSGVRSLRLLRGAIVLAGALGLSVVAVQLAPTQAQAAGDLHYQRGHYLASGWYCYGWSNGTYHCTQHWHRSGGRIISDNPSWVPNGGSVSVSAPKASKGSSTVRTSVHLRGPNTYPWGQCTWYARARGGAELNGLGNAGAWAANARRRGLAVGYAPRAGATVVFAVGVQGASRLGHVAHVERVLGGGRFLVSEMNYFGYGGGFGRVSQRVAHTGAGVSFIY